MISYTVPYGELHGITERFFDVLNQQVSVFTRRYYHQYLRLNSGRYSLLNNAMMIVLIIKVGNTRNDKMNTRMINIIALILTIL